MMSLEIEWNNFDRASTARVGRLYEQGKLAMPSLIDVNEIGDGIVRFYFQDLAITDADVDSFLASFDPDLPTAVEVQAGHVADARASITSIWQSPAFQNNVKGATPIEIDAWLASLSESQERSTLANLIVLVRDALIILNSIEA